MVRPEAPMTPAQLTRISTVGLFTCAADRLTLCVSATSTWTTLSVPFDRCASSASPCAASGLRHAAMTVSPSARYWRVNSNPNPRLAPVMSTVDMAYPRRPTVSVYHYCAARSEERRVGKECRAGGVEDER